MTQRFEIIGLVNNDYRSCQPTLQLGFYNVDCCGKEFIDLRDAMVMNSPGKESQLLLMLLASISRKGSRNL